MIGKYGWQSVTTPLAGSALGSPQLRVLMVPSTLRFLHVAGDTLSVGSGLMFTTPAPVIVKSFSAASSSKGLLKVVSEMFVAPCTYGGEPRMVGLPFVLTLPLVTMPGNEVA